MAGGLLRGSPRHARRARVALSVPLVGLALATAAVTAWRTGWLGDLLEPGAPAPAAQDARAERPAPAPRPTDPVAPAPARGSREAVAPSPSAAPSPALRAEPINTAFSGLTTFRGNATRTYYGEGPVPAEPAVLWRYPASGAMCSTSSDQHGTRLWCGTGWTGQPNVVEHEDGSIEVRFGAYDRAVHFLDGLTGQPVRERFVTGDLIKGTVTTDPDGFPLLYVGSRDNRFRILALDRGDAPVELWSMDAYTAPNPVWNNDWDGSALVVGDYLLEGGENSWFYVVKLNRDYDRDGKVTVDPKIVVLAPGFDDQLFADVGDRDVSIENSVAFHDGVVYFTNSGGLVQGWDISKVLEGGKEFRRVFRFWSGDDTDASIVVDDEGFLYVASELQRFNARSSEVGQLVKLDPRRPRRPLVWSVPVRELGDDGLGGMWATPAIAGNFLYAATNRGDLLAVNRETGEVAWRMSLPGPLWSSPVVVDDVLIQGDCAGVLHAFDVSRPWKRPSERWTVQLEGCIESTPAVWHGMVFVGTRGGFMYGIGDRA